MVHIAALAMVKDEEKRIHVTLNSMIGIFDSLIIYDTGSTDRTIDIIREFCDKHKMPLRLKQGTFVDFATSRNVSLDFADTFLDVDFILLFDANDELQGGPALRSVIEKEYLNKDKTAYLVCQKLKRTTGIVSFYNVRMIKPRCGWRYQGVVHEGFELNNATITKASKLPEQIVLYQDRDEDAEKSQRRFARDKQLLMKEHEKDPKNPRTVYYLAQTLDMLEEFELSEKFHRLRTELDGFIEERFVSAFRVAFLQKKWEDSFTWYMKAYMLQPRAEPLVNISEHFRKQERWELGYHFSKLACELSYPEHSLFYVDRKAYDYDRWFALAVNAFNYRKFSDGFEAIKKVISTPFSNDFDKSIYNLYTKVLADPNLVKQLSSGQIAPAPSIPLTNAGDVIPNASVPGGVENSGLPVVTPNRTPIKITAAD